MPPAHDRSRMRSAIQRGRRTSGRCAPRRAARSTRPARACRRHAACKGHRRPDMQTQAFDSARPNPADPVASLPDAAKRPRKRRVLVAEDDRDMRRLVVAVLRAAGHTVVEARNGVELLERIDSNSWSESHDPFDVIVTDVGMPGLSGLNALAAIRAARWTMPVILITAFGNRAMKSEARALGAEVLDKPLDLEALRETVARSARHV